MFQVQDIVKPSGKGRTKTWRNIKGTVTNVSDHSVFVIWHGTCVEDELDVDEVIKTGRNTAIPKTYTTLSMNKNNVRGLLKPL